MDRGLRNTLIVSGLLGGVSVGGYFLYRSILKAIYLALINNTGVTLNFTSNAGVLIENVFDKAYAF